jgi:hypothetical protein
MTTADTDKTAEPAMDQKHRLDMTAYLIATALMFGHIVSYGFVFQQCWAWFMVTAFGLPEISIWHAAGMVLTTLLFFPIGRNKGISGTDMFDRLILKPVLVLVFAWALASFTL